MSRARYERIENPRPLSLNRGVTFTDPFGLCEDENGNWRRCTVTWVGGANADITQETRDLAQRLADSADVDLLLSSGRREGSCDDSLHNCGMAFDISKINGVDIGQGWVYNPEAHALVQQVQNTAQRFSEVRENFGPSGLYRSPSSGQPQAWLWPLWPDRRRDRLFWPHQNHIHIGMH